jgi:hypothetical protein
MTIRATLIAEKIDTAVRHVRQIEPCPMLCEVSDRARAFSRPRDF